MTCASGEYHPYAACMMFRGMPDADSVRINLGLVLDHGRALERDSANQPGEIRIENCTFEVCP